MTYQEFKQSVELLVETGGGGGFWATLAMNPLFSTFISFFVFFFFVFFVSESLNSNTFAYSPVLKAFEKVDQDLKTILTIVSIILTGGTFFIMGIMFLENENVNFDYSESKVNNVYIKYMNEQPNIKIKIVELVLEKEKIQELSYYEEFDANIFDNAKCENCVKKEVAFKSNEKEQNYKRGEVLVSYSLAKDKKPYIVTKPTLREDVLHLKQGSLYNPVLYVPKEYGGILE